MITASEYGVTAKGERVTAYILTNRSGMRVVLLDYGAIIQSVVVPDREGRPTDVMLGYDTLADYEQNPPHFGAVIGRNGNRIAKGRFFLDGREIQLAVNETARGNNLHSGPDFYEHRLYESEKKDADNAVAFTLHTLDGDQGFPGAFTLTVTYTLTEENQLCICYEGRSDKVTIANVTNHSYWNLNGEGSGTILHHRVQIQADAYTPVDESAIPTGEIRPVAGTPFDFRTEKEIARDADAPDPQLAITGGYDHNYALDGSGFREVARVTGEKSGIVMTVSTDQPGMQFYAGNFIRGPKGKGQKTYAPRTGLALETQHFPNCVNIPAFASSVLAAGETYRTSTCYGFGVTKDT